MLKKIIIILLVIILTAIIPICFVFFTAQKKINDYQSEQNKKIYTALIDHLSKNIDFLYNKNNNSLNNDEDKIFISDIYKDMEIINDGFLIIYDKDHNLFLYNKDDYKKIINNNSYLSIKKICPKSKFEISFYYKK
jgi:hypothetical protein